MITLDIQSLTDIIGNEDDIRTILHSDSDMRIIHNGHRHNQSQSQFVHNYKFQSPKWYTVGARGQEDNTRSIYLYTVYDDGTFEMETLTVN